MAWDDSSEVREQKRALARKRGLIFLLAGCEVIFFMMGFLSTTMTWSPWIFLSTNLVTAGGAALVYGGIQLIENTEP